MQICHINLAREFRGGERQTFLLMQGLAKLGVNQKLICRKNSPLASKASSIPGLDIIEIGKPFLFHVKKASGSSLIHAHEGRSTHFAFYSRKMTSIPFIITRRIPNLPGSSFSTRIAYKAATLVVAISQAIKNQLLHYQPSLAVKVIPSMRSDLTFSDDSVQQLTQKYAGKFIVGHIGALVDHHKGQKTIIDAARSLAECNPELHFLLLGNGKDEQELKNYAKGLSNIEFVGFVDNVGDYLKLFDVFIFPSREEGLGSILLDVMQFGKPIIASNVDGIPDIISHNHNGLLIDPGNAEQLRENIMLVKNSPELVHKFTQQGSLLIKNYSVEKISQIYLDLYREILDSGE